MTSAQKITEIGERHRRDLERAADTIREHQESETFGTVSFHFQRGRIVRTETSVSESWALDTDGPPVRKKG